MRALILAGLLALVSLSFPSAMQSASAAAGGITSPNIVLYDDCDYHPVSYDLGLPENTDGWSADIHVIGPDGLEAGSGFVYGSSAYDDQGTEKVFLCDDPRPGRYGLRAEVETCDDDYNCVSYSVKGGAFTVRYPRSRTTIAVRGGSRLTFSVAVTDERPRGMFPSDAYTQVVLQKKQGARWVRVAGGSTNSLGKVRLSVRNRPGREMFRAQAVFSSYDSIANSVSKAVTVR